MIFQTQTHASFLARLGGRGGSEPASPEHALAWQEFIHRYGDLIRASCVRHNLRPTDSDDVMQDVLMSLTKAMPGFVYDPAKGKFRAYLKTVTLHAVYKKLCQKREGATLEDVASMAQTASGDPAIEAHWEQEWRRYHLRQAMTVIESEYSASDRSAFDLYAVQGVKPEQVGQRVGISVDAVYQAKSRITKRLAALIEAQIAEEG